MGTGPILEVAGVRKQYQGLRPLRMTALSIQPGERVALSGLDAGAAEVFVNLVTGASIPDEGQVIVNGRGTASISDGDAWLTWLDQFGIVSPRAVLLDAATLLQNLAMPITLDIEPVQADVAARVVRLAGDDPELFALLKCDEHILLGRKMKIEGAPRHARCCCDRSHVSRS